MKNSNDGLAMQATTFEVATKKLDYALKSKICLIEQNLIENKISENMELIQVSHVYRWYDLALCKIRIMFGKQNPGPSSCLKEFCKSV